MNTTGCLPQWFVFLRFLASLETMLIIPQDRALVKGKIVRDRILTLVAGG